MTTDMINLALNGVYEVTSPGFLRIKGRDRKAFLQRMSTNEIESLQPGQVVTTVLTSAAARILDVMQVFELDDDSLGVIPLPSRAERTLAFLRGKIFFNDQVSLEDLSSDQQIFDAYGSQGESLVLEVSSSLPELHQVMISKDAILIGQPGLDDTVCYRMLFSTNQPPSIHEMISEASYQAARVAYGIAGPNGELIEEYTPLEVGLRWAVSLDKGCYTGQEVIARQVNYDKITRQLVRLQLDSPVVIGDKVVVEGRSVGEITSIASHPELGEIALAVLKKTAFDPGTRVNIGDTDGVVLPSKREF